MAERSTGRVVARDGQEDEEGTDLLGGEHVLAQGVVDQGRGEVIGGVLAPELGEFVHQPDELHAGTEERTDEVPRFQRGAVEAHHLGVAASEDDVGGAQDRVELAAGDAHHVADDQEREWLGERFDQVRLALLAHVVDDLGADGLDGIEDTLQLPGSEGSSDDAALSGVTGIIEGDERAEELQRLWRHVRDVGGALA